MIKPDALPTLSTFRELRDEFQARRRLQVLPQLNATKDRLARDLGILYRQHKNALKHDQQRIDNDMRPLQWQYQETVAQLAVIEDWLPSCPERWRVEVFEINQLKKAG